MPLFKVAIVIICAVAVLAPICIYIVGKYSDLNAYRKRIQRSSDLVMGRKTRDDDA